jgi:protein involved in sex pheromone biosynthesis
MKPPLRNTAHLRNDVVSYFFKFVNVVGVENFNDKRNAHKIKTNICTVFSYTESIAPTHVSRSHHQGVPSLHVPHIH